MIHHVQGGLVPGRVGTDLRRTYEFARNRLILTAAGEGAALRLVWERERD